MDLERRRAPRYQFIAHAQVTEIVSNTRLDAKTGDLSIGGCFLNMRNPSPEGAEIQLRISHANTEFTALGRVVFVFPNLGIGVMFTSVATDQLAVLEEWLTALSDDVSYVQGEE